jgi:hypothetical protein
VDVLLDAAEELRRALGDQFLTLGSHVWASLERGRASSAP